MTDSGDRTLVQQHRLRDVLHIRVWEFIFSTFGNKIIHQSSLLY
jgi:hypothetical protein